jgi:nucleoid DNA-binding protein
MNLLEEFANEYIKRNKKYTKVDIKDICNSFINHINLDIEKKSKENKTNEKEINIITLKGLGKFSISYREGRRVFLAKKEIEINDHWVLRFKSSSVIKNKLKEK